MRGLAFLISLFLFTSVHAVEKLVVTGSSTVAPLIAEIGKAFEKQNKDIRVEVQTGGSTRGVIEARRGLNDIGMISRNLKSAEADLKPFAIALDGIAIITHSSNPVGELSSEQIVKIYKKEIRNWKDVGGKDAPIVVVNKAEGRSTLELFLKHFNVKNSELKPDVIIGDNEQGIKSVAGNKNSIGYVSIGAGEVNISQGVPIQLLPLKGIEASTANIKKGQYPLSRTLNLVVKSEPQGLKKRFIEFAQSQFVNNIILQQSFVPLSN